MTDFLNEDVSFRGKVTHEGEVVANGTLTIGPGGLSIGESIDTPAESWLAMSRVRVANETERDAVVAWRVANLAISASNPLLVWRANGSLTGVNEMTIDGDNWYAESPLAGDLEMTMAADAPYGWLLCQGQVLANAAVDYPALWLAANDVFRVGGSLRLPDLRGRVPMGAGQGPGLSLRNLGDAVGAEGVILTEAQLAAHAHEGTSDFADRSLNHRHTMAFGSTESGDNIAGTAKQYETSGAIARYTSFVADTSDPTTNAGLDHRHEFTTDDAGSGQAHPNVQPSAIVNFKVKV